MTKYSLIEGLFRRLHPFLPHRATPWSGLASSIGSKLPASLKSSILRIPFLPALLFGPETQFVHEVRLRDFVKELVEEGWVCADVGAHVGYHALPMVEQCGPSGQVVCFEPHPQIARRLEQAIGLKGARCAVSIEQMAVSNGALSTAQLHRRAGQEAGDWSIVRPEVNASLDGTAFEVVSLSLDEYFASRRPPDFVKIDVEGAEALVLEGMAGLLSTKRPILAIEFHDQRGWAGRKELFERDYVLFDSNGGELSCDDARSYHVFAFPREKLDMAKQVFVNIGPFISGWRCN